MSDEMVSVPLDALRTLAKQYAEEGDYDVDRYSSCISGGWGESAAIESLIDCLPERQWEPSDEMLRAIQPILSNSIVASTRVLHALHDARMLRDEGRPCSSCGIRLSTNDWCPLCLQVAQSVREEPDESHRTSLDLATAVVDAARDFLAVPFALQAEALRAAVIAYDWKEGRR